jgi:hypothetical protein
VELRLLELIVRIFDPRRWRRRLAQLGLATGWLAWIWVRAVRRAERERIVADARHLERTERIDADNARRERERLADGIQPDSGRIVASD